MPFIRIKSLKDKIKKDVVKKCGLSHSVFEGNGDSYKGEWKDDLKDGFGTQVWKKKNIMYTGYWKKGKRCGQGMLYPVDKKDIFIYNGMWKNDKRSDHGVQCYPDGGRYDGIWKRDKRHGHGRMRYSDGSAYDGNWLKDERSGKGEMVFADGSVYSGDWEKDVKCGQGIMNSKKYIYDGAWRNDMKHGEATYFSYTTGAELAGVWLKDIPCCGTMEVVNPDVATSPMKYDIPPCTLKDPESVTEEARRHYMEKA